MGLISTVTGAVTGAVGTVLGAGAGALGGVLADQWKEYFYCEAIPNDILVTKGEKRTGGRSVNKKGSDNIISNGSVIAVADGQCMIIVEQGKIVEVCAEPGEFIYDTSTEPSIFAGSLGSSILATFQAIGRRFTFGGDTGKDQRVYYFNTKEILDNKFGTNNPIDFRVVDSKVGFDMDVSLRINGSYTFKVVNPLLFYANVCGNVETAYNKSLLTNQMRTEFVDALAPALSRVSDLEIRPSKLPQYTNQLKDAINIELAKTWTETRGIAVENIAMNPPTLTEEDKQKLQNAQEAAVYSNPLLAAGAIAGGQAQAWRNMDGASPSNMMVMSGIAGGMSPSSLFEVAQNQGAQMPAQTAQPAAPAAAAAPAADSWTCTKCNTVNTGKFCVECGEKKPEPVAGWTCPDCNTVNQGKFCTNCGTKKPAGAPLYKCDKCGWMPEDPKNPPKFCPQCGDPFDDKDSQ